MRLKTIIKQFLSNILPEHYYSHILILYWRLRNIVFRSYEPELRLLPQFVRRGDTVLDIGANLGQYSLPLSKLVGTDGRVIAFEALPSTFDIGRKIAKGSNITYHNLAVSNKNGTVRLSTYIDEAGLLNRGISSIVESIQSLENHTIEVNCTTLDSFLVGHNDKISFMKCDVEGHEVEVIIGAQKTIANNKPTLLLETNDHNLRKIQELLMPLGYNPKVMNEHGELIPKVDKMKGVYNCLFIRNR